jgi:hypothetical protein
MPKAWKPAFTKVRSLEHLKNVQARDICDKISESGVLDPIYPTPTELYVKYFEPGQVDTHVLQPEVVEPEHEFQPILPELWQPWMARQIMEREFDTDHMDYVEAMERRDKITDALILLRSEAAALDMQDVLARISTAGAALLDELWQKGGLGD